MVDSLKIYETLTSVALPEPQARAIAKAIGTAFDDNELHHSKSLADKVDTTKFASDMRQMETTLKQEIAVLREDIAVFKAEMMAFKAEIQAELHKMESRMVQDTRDIIRWIVALFIGQFAATIGVVFTVIKLLK